LPNKLGVQGHECISHALNVLVKIHNDCGCDNLHLFERRWPYYFLNVIFWTRGIVEPYAGGLKLRPNDLDGKPSVFFHQVRR
jgi:hypothetical protein